MKKIKNYSFLLLLSSTFVVNAMNIPGEKTIQEREADKRRLEIQKTTQELNAMDNKREIFIDTVHGHGVLVSVQPAKL